MKDHESIQAQAMAHLSSLLWLLPWVVVVIWSSPASASVKKPPIYICNSKANGTTVEPIWIDPPDNLSHHHQHQVGHLQTPNFPRPFPLPLECLWVFNLTRISPSQQQQYLHFYFTQFYLSDNILMVTSLNSSWPLKARNVLKWSEVDSIGLWTNGRQMQSTIEDTYILLRLRITSKSYDRLHKRVLEVNDVYGFNITYESLPSPKERSDVCTLGLCNFNGECFLNINSTTNHVGDFFCHCAYPKFSPTRGKPFSGDRCQFHGENSECTPTENVCKNNAPCRYQSSRYIDCQCPEGFKGQFCEKKVVGLLQPALSSGLASEDNCPRFYTELEVPAKDLNQAFKLVREIALPLPWNNGKRLETYQSFQLKKASKNNNEGGSSSKVVGVISFRWDQEITPDGMEVLSKALRNISGLATKLANKSITGSSFCTRMVHPPDILLASGHQVEVTRSVLVGNEFSLTCNALGVSNPVIVWYKDDDYKIDSSIALRSDRITQDTRKSETDPEEFAGILFFKDVNELDSGKFKCVVFDVGNETRVPEAQLHQYPSTEAFVNVEVVLRPKIDVFPASTTLVKSQNGGDHRHAFGQNHLHCFAHPTVPWDVAKYYVYEWYKLENNETVAIQPNQPLIEYQEVMIKPPGLVLTLGKIERDCVYKCRVYDSREIKANNTSNTPDRKLVTEIQIPVYVAEKLEDTCGEAYEDGIVWPITKKGNVAVSKCVVDEGFEYHKCNPTSENSKPTWSPPPVNDSDCVKKTFLTWEKDLNMILCGYVKNASEDVQLVRKLFHFFPDLSKSQVPRVREWQIVLSLLRKALEYASTRSLALNYTAIAESFYSQSLSSLSSWVRGFHKELGPSKTLKILQVFNLIVKSVQLFGQKSAPNQQKILTPNKAEQVQFEGFARRQINPCEAGLILVNFAQISLPLNANLTTWIKSSQPKLSKDSYFTVLSLDQKAPIFMTPPPTSSVVEGRSKQQPTNYIPTRHHENLPECNGMTSVNVSLSSNNDPRNASAIVGVIYYKDLEDAFNRTHELDDNKTTKKASTTTFQRASTLVSVIYEGPSYVKLEVAIRFYDFALAFNDSRLGSLRCASVQIPSSPSHKQVIEQKMWDPQDSSCEKIPDPQGVICRCTKPGTYALVTFIDDLKSSINPGPQDHEYIVILSCGCSLTLCCLTLIILIWDIFKTKCGRTLLQAQVTLILALAMIAVILKIAKFLNQDYFPGISLFLHYLLSCSLWCQINMPAALYAEASWKYCHQEFKAFLITLSMIIPTIYTGIAAHYQSPIKISWFVLLRTEQFHAFISMNIVFLMGYLTLMMALVSLYRTKGIHKNFDSISMIKRSASVTLVIVIFEAALVYYANFVPPTISSQFILSLACAALGVTIFWCYVVPDKSIPLPDEGCAKLPELTSSNCDGPPVSRSTSMNSGRSSSFRDWRDPQMSVTTNTTLNHEEQSLISGCSIGSRESARSKSGAALLNKTNSKTLGSSSVASTMLPMPMKHSTADRQHRSIKKFNKTWNADEPESITVTPAIVPCRLRLDSTEGSCDDQCSEIRKNPHEPLHTLICNLSSSQDPIDSMLTTKVDIHVASSRTSSTSSYNEVQMKKRSCHSVNSSVRTTSEGCESVQDSEYVLMTINNNFSQQQGNNISPATDLP